MLLEPLGSDPLACAGQERRGEASEQGWLGCAAGSRAKKEHAQAARQGKVLAGGHPLNKWAALTAPHSHLQLCLHQQLCLLQHLLHRRKHDCALQLQGLLGMCSGAERGAWGVGDSACHPATKAHEALKGARLRVGGFRREALCRNVRSYMHEGATTRLTSSPSCQVRPAQPAPPPHTCLLTCTASVRMLRWDTFATCWASRGAPPSLTRVSSSSICAAGVGHG